MSKNQHTTLIRGLLLAAALLGGAPALAVEKEADGIRFTPFTLIATLPPVLKKGVVDPVATDAKAQRVALKIGTFVARYDESSAGIAETNWVLAGAPEGLDADQTAIESAILRIPTPEPIDPTQPVSPTNTKMVNLLEVCNKTLASKALGVLPVVGETYVAHGALHATALPCEVAVYSNKQGIRIEMLNAQAIFSLFFTDVLLGKQMQDPEFAAALQGLPKQANDEIQAIVYRALERTKLEHTPQNRPLGPWFKSSWDLIRAVLSTPLNAPYVHMTYAKDDGTLFTNEEVVTVAHTIVETMTIHGQPGAGIHDPELEARLSPGSQWRSARHAPLVLPGQVQLIEGCSPLYAKQALGTGLHHATALPCELAVTKTADGARLLVSYLDPHFMFNAMFTDAFADMTEEEREAFARLPGIVLADLQTIVQYTFDEKLPGLGIAVREPVALYHDMLPF